MQHEKKVPTSHLGRFARVAAATARVGATRLFAGDPQEGAERAAELLGHLRGLAAKLGQMAAYVDGAVPDAQKEVYEKAMRGLLAAAPRSAPHEIRRVVESELKAPIAKLFVSFDDAPLASASVGQVHRAVLTDGRAVAVKVQHPGIREAMRSDFDNIGLLEQLAALGGGRKLDSKRLLQEVKTRLSEELDYTLEASRQERFRALHAGDPTIRIPAIVQERSTSAVLTSELASGLRFEEAIRASEAERRAWCETLWRFVYKGILRGDVFNADPHPGNYFFRPGGEIVFLDFGCVQEIPAARRAAGEALHRAALERDEAAFRQAGRALMDLRGGGHEERTLHHLRDIYRPLFSSPFRITREFSAGLLRQMREFGVKAKGAGHDDAYVALPEGILFMNRLQFGFYSILARMDVEVDYAAVERAFL